MFKLLRKIAVTPRVALPTAAFKDQEVDVVGAALEKKVRRMFAGSLAIREVAAGSSNAEEQELIALGNAYYDVERFGVHFVASPRHADMLMVTGPVSVNMAEGLRRTYDAMPTPRVVVAVGDGAIHGSVFAGSYAVHDRVSDVIPVDFEIPGDPPSPKVILAALLRILTDMESTHKTTRDTVARKKK